MTVKDLVINGITRISLGLLELVAELFCPVPLHIFGNFITVVRWLVKKVKVKNYECLYAVTDFFGHVCVLTLTKCT